MPRFEMCSDQEFRKRVLAAYEAGDPLARKVLEDGIDARAWRIRYDSERRPDPQRDGDDR